MSYQELSEQIVQALKEQGPRASAELTIQVILQEHFKPSQDRPKSKDYVTPQQYAKALQDYATFVEYQLKLERKKTLQAYLDYSDRYNKAFRSQNSKALKSKLQRATTQARKLLDLLESDPDQPERKPIAR